MKVAHVLQAQDIAMLSSVHKKLGAILDSVNGKASSITIAVAKKRGPKPGSKRAKKGKKYDPATITVTPAPDAPVPA